VIRSVLQLGGRVIWWCTLPVLWLILNNTERTRLVLKDGQGQVLLVRTWLSADGKWGLPGGGMHRDEDETQGVLREVKEEVGIVLQPEDVRNLGTRNVKTKGLHFRTHLFMATVVDDPSLRLQWYEIADAQWIKLSMLSPDKVQQEVLEVAELLGR